MYGSSILLLSEKVSLVVGVSPLIREFSIQDTMVRLWYLDADYQQDGLALQNGTLGHQIKYRA